MPMTMNAQDGQLGLESEFVFLVMLNTGVDHCCEAWYRGSGGITEHSFPQAPHFDFRRPATR
jgi:hypothetical protein